MKNESNGESTLNRKLLTYSVAAGTALALARPAGAEIICSSPPGGEGRVNSANPLYCIDLDGDTQDDFCFSYWGTRFQMSYGTRFGVSFGGIWLYAAGKGGYLLRGGVDPCASNLDPGAPAGPTQANWYTSGSLNDYLVSYFCPGKTCTTVGPYTSCNFCDDRGYIGVQFDIDGQPRYGWIEYEGTCGNGVTAAGRVVEWCYEDEADTAVKAGDRGLPIPTLTPLGVLLLAGLILAGGAAAMGRRRKEDR